MDVQRLLTEFLGSQSGGDGSGSSKRQGGSGLPGGLLGGAAAGGLVAALLGSKKARKFGGKAVTYGGLAVLGGLAYKAWRDHKANAPHPNPAGPLPAPEPAPAGSPFDPAALRDRRGEDFRLTLMKAMISAAMADGHIDQRENQIIRDQVAGAGLAEDEKGFLFEQLSRPSDPLAIADLTSGEEQATEVYLASALIVDPDGAEDRRYLDRLGDALRLPEDLRKRLDEHAEQARAEA